MTKKKIFILSAVGAFALAILLSVIIIAGVANSKNDKTNLLNSCPIGKVC